MSDSADDELMMVGPLEAETTKAIEAATHLTDQDLGTVQALLVVARKVDQDEQRWELALKWAEQMKLRPPSQDNVSLPTYLKYCEALGLTPSGRVKLGPGKGTEGGKLAQLRALDGKAKRATG